MNPHSLLPLLCLKKICVDVSFLLRELWLVTEFDDEAEHYNGFFGKSFGQAWGWFKERKRAQSVALHGSLTYVTLPWHRIIAGNYSRFPFYYQIVTKWYIFDVNGSNCLPLSTGWTFLVF